MCLKRCESVLYWLFVEEIIISFKKIDMKVEDQAFLRPEEAAEFLSISRSKIYDLADDPEFPNMFHITDNIAGFDRSDLEAFLEQKKQDQISE